MINTLAGLNIHGNVDLNNNQLKKVVIDNLVSDPAGTEGKIYYNTVTNKLRLYASGVWVDLSTGAGVLTYDLTGTGSTNGTAGILLTGSDASTDTVLIVGAGTVGVTRSGNTLTVTGTESALGTVTSVTGTGTVSGLTLTGTVTTSGNLTLGGTLLLTSGDVTTALGFTPGPGTVTNVSGTSPVSVATGTTTPVISMPAATTSVNGYLTSTDWGVFNGKQNALSGTGLVKSVSGVISYITDNSANWDTAYNDRITSLTTTGTGAATLVANVLNIPIPSSATFVSLTTTGDSGSSTLVSGILNVPTYTLAGLGGISLTSLSSTATGLTYTNTTGVFSLTSGYLIPTTASYNNTNWDSAYTNRITSLTTIGTGAATLISNVLNIPTPPTATFTSLTTLGSSGLSTLIGGVLNVPGYTLTGLGGVPTSRTLTINGTAYDLSADRTWNVGTVTSVSATSPITSSGGTTPTISTSMATNKLIGRSTAGTGIMEEITVGTGLTLSSGTLNATAQTPGFEMNFLLMGA